MNGVSSLNVIDYGDHWLVYLLASTLPDESDYGIRWMRKFSNFEALPEMTQFAVAVLQCWSTGTKSIEPLGMRVSETTFVLNVTAEIVEEYRIAS